MPIKSKSVVIVLGVCLGLFFSVSTFAQVPSGSFAGAQSAAMKIAVVNMPDAIVSTDEGKKELTALEQRFAVKQDDLKKASDEVEGLKKQLATPDPKISEDQRKNLANTLENKQKVFQRNYEDFQTEVQKTKLSQSQ